jgi:hypothetical protein
MGKIEKTFWWICFVLAIYTTIGFKVVPDIIKDQLVKNLDENLTLKTTIEKVEFNPFSLNTKIHNFKLGDEKETVISFEMLNANIAFLRSIFELHASIEEVQLKKLFVNVVQEKDGSINLSKLLKPSDTKVEEKSKDTSSSDIKFLVSKILLQNANINFTKENEKKPYKLVIKDLNYSLYDLGTYKDALSSNDLNLKINEHTNLNITGAFKLQPFNMYGKAKISDLRVKEFTDYENQLFNFDISENANINLNFDYNIDLKDKTDVKLTSTLFELNNIALNQNKNTIAKLDKLNIQKFLFDLSSQKIELDSTDINKLTINMIQDKDGINFANLINSSNEVKTEVKEKEKNSDSKPWIINLKNTKLNTSDFVFDDRINSLLVQTKNFNTNMNNLNINGSDINLDSIALINPKISFNDNKNALAINTKNTNIKVNDLNIKNSIVSIKNIDIKDDNINLDENKSKMNISIDKTNLLVNSLKINGSKIDISNSKLKTSKINFKDLNTKLNINTTNSNLDVNTLNINGSKIDISAINLNAPLIALDDSVNKMNIDIKNSIVDLKSFGLNSSDILIKTIKLSKPNITLVDKTNNISLKTNDLEILANSLSQKKDTLSLGSLRILEPNVEFLNTQDGTKILANNLDLSVTKLSNSSKGIKVDRAALNKPVISVILPKQNNSKKETSVAKKENNKNDDSSKTKLDIGPLKIINATLNFEDKNLPVPFKTTVTKLNGKVSEFKNTISSSTKLELDGIVDKYGTTKITGIVNPSSIKILTDINMIFKNIAMQNFTPYTAKFIGRELDSGKLDLDLKYNIEKSNLEAKNSVTINKLKLGEKVQSPDAVSLPLELAIALLEDSSGVIDLNLPISGNIDDPQFSIAPIVFKAFVNLITKAITSPFSLLGSIFGFDENEIKNINFEFGEDKVTPIQKETLDKISKILTKRPNLALKLIPSYDEQKDLEALQKVSFEKIVDSKIPNKDNKDYQAKYIDLLENLYNKYGKNAKDLKQTYIKNEKLEAKSYIKNLEKFIISKQEVEKSQLETMAKNRIINIQKYLLEEKKIDKKQVLTSNDIKIKTQSKKTSDIDLKIDKLN